MPQSLKDKMNAISEQGLCTGCGICQSLAGKENIKLAKTSNGFERPVIVGKLSEELVNKIYDVCPGISINGMPQDRISKYSKFDKVWGPWLRLVRAWASDNEVRYKASTGGVLTALGQFLIRKKKVERILHIKASKSDVTFGEQQLSFTTNQVLEGTGARYGPAAPLVNVKEILDQNITIAIIAKPCDLTALRNYSYYDDRVNKLVKYWLTPVCGGYMTPEGLSKFLSRNAINYQHIKNFRYRGHGCPGPTRVETYSEIKDFHYLDFWGEGESSWPLPFRCNLCADGIGEVADIVASDTWENGSPNREDSETDLGTNGVIIRTDAGNELFNEAVEEGDIIIEKDITFEEMNNYQPHQVQKKYAVQDRYIALEDLQRMRPKTKDLRIEELSSELNEQQREFEKNNTKKRIVQGKGIEPTPSKLN